MPTGPSPPRSVQTGMLAISICDKALALDLGLPVSQWDGPCQDPSRVIWVDWVGSWRETYGQVGAASLMPHAGALRQLLSSWCWPETHPKEFGSGLPRAGQAWDGAGWYVGCCLAGLPPGWPPQARALGSHCSLIPSSSSPSFPEVTGFKGRPEGTKTFRELV